VGPGTTNTHRRFERHPGDVSGGGGGEMMRHNGAPAVWGSSHGGGVRRVRGALVRRSRRLRRR